MTVVTKYNIGETVYHIISGDECLIISILFTSNLHTEYKVTMGVNNYGFVVESELTRERRVFV